MPYKMSAKCIRMLKSKPMTSLDLTDLQEKAIEYLNVHSDEKRFIHAAEIAEYWGYPNGMYFRGVLSSLEKKGLLLKEEDAE